MSDAAGRRAAEAARPAEAVLRTPGNGRHWVLVAAAGMLLALAAGGVVVALTFEAATWEALARLGPPIAAALAALMLGSWLAAGGRMWVLTRAMGHRLRFRDALRVAVCGEFGVAASPTGLGGTALRLGVLRTCGVPLGDGSAAVAADLILDVGVAILITAVALPLAFVMPGGQPMAEELARGIDPRVAAWAGGILAALALAVAAWKIWSARRRRRPPSAAAARARRAGGGRSAAPTAARPGSRRRSPGSRPRRGPARDWRTRASSPAPRPPAAPPGDRGPRRRRSRGAWPRPRASPGRCRA